MKIKKDKFYKAFSKKLNDIKAFKIDSSGIYNTTIKMSSCHGCGACSCDECDSSEQEKSCEKKNCSCINKDKKDGCFCRKCKEFLNMAEPDDKGDGMTICWRCKNR
jgi:hypothetical protein